MHRYRPTVCYSDRMAQCMCMVPASSMVTGCMAKWPYGAVPASGIVPSLLVNAKIQKNTHYYSDLTCCVRGLCPHTTHHPTIHHPSTTLSEPSHPLKLLYLTLTTPCRLRPALSKTPPSPAPASWEASTAASGLSTLTFSTRTPPCFISRRTSFLDFPGRAVC